MHIFFNLNQHQLKATHLIPARCIIYTLYILSDYSNDYLGGKFVLFMAKVYISDNEFPACQNLGSN